eukprot:1814265-Prymnesium_polylepis.1
MTHAVAAWPPDRPGGIVVGKTTHVWCPRVSVAGPAIPCCNVAVVACVGNPGSIWGNVRFHCAPVWYYSASNTHGERDPPPWCARAREGLQLLQPAAHGPRRACRSAR